MYNRWENSRYESIVCDGCNSQLLEYGLSCEEQKLFYETGEYTIDGKTYREGSTERLGSLPYRCSCDEECVYLGDCCPDYQATCPEMYPNLSGSDYSVNVFVVKMTFLRL